MAEPCLFIVQSPPVSHILERLHTTEQGDLPFCSDTWRPASCSTNALIERIFGIETADVTLPEEYVKHFEVGELEDYVAEIIRDVDVHIGALWENILCCEVASMDGTLHLHVVH